jgi:hypothetical protein
VDTAQLFISADNFARKTYRHEGLAACTSYRLNIFRALLCPSSGARDYNVDYHIGRFVLGLLQTKNETTNVVINIIVASS